MGVAAARVYLFQTLKLRSAAVAASVRSQKRAEQVNEVIELDELRVARALAEQKAPRDWRAFVRAVARDVVEHLPDVVVWKTAPALLNVAATTLSAAALSGGLSVQRIDGALCLMVRESEEVLIEIMSVRLAVPRPLVTVPM
jgi:hypothetical protein